MATTASYIPIVGCDRIVSIENNGEGGSDPVPVSEGQTSGRPGKMRIAFRLEQSDTQNTDDGRIRLIVQRPLAVGVLDEEGDAEDRAPYTPILHITPSSSTTPPDTHPRIVARDVEGDQVEDGVMTVDLYFEPSLEEGIAKYDVLIDWSWSGAS